MLRHSLGALKQPTELIAMSALRGKEPERAVKCRSDQPLQDSKLPAPE